MHDCLQITEQVYSSHLDLADVPFGDLDLEIDYDGSIQGPWKQDG